jgi:D-alanyl-D-alanine carboxypeptidase/D-alanyl-D-alanine-endopeptidase (penicillin-binding protein 4)
MPYRLRLFVAPVVFAILALIVAPPAAGAPRTTTKRLSSEVQQALKHSSSKHVDYAINISNVGTISHDADRLSAPASNEKLFTIITLLQLLGPDFRYDTTVSGTSDVVSGTLDGDLVLRGSGDPTLTKDDLHRFAKRLHARGLRHVTGHLIVDDTRYSHQTLAPGWKHDFVPEESGTVDAFTIDHNVWRGGRAFDADPTPDNARLWRKVLKKSHISVAGSTRIEAAPPTPVLLVTHHSIDLATLIDATLTYSINFDAEMMLREAGAQLTGHGTPTTGIEAVDDAAKKLGLAIGTVHDGSGLSYTDREAPSTILDWLTTIRDLPDPTTYDTVFFAMPLACRTGTLENRLCGPHVKGKVRAKTGTLDHISALSGYVTANSGDRVAFSFLLSGIKNFTKAYNRVDAAIGVIVRNG